MVIMDVNEAIQALEDAVRSSLDAAKKEGAKAFEAGQFERAKQAADDGKTIEAFVEEVTRLKRRWENLQNVSKETSRTLETPVHQRGGPPSGDPLNPERLIQSVLRVLEDLGGTAQRDDVFDRLEQIVLEQVKSANGGNPESGLPSGWEETLVTVQKMMVKRGLLHAKPQRGIWQITPQGRLILFENQ
jgi:hypothetical protein